MCIQLETIKLLKLSSNKKKFAGLPLVKKHTRLMLLIYLFINVAQSEIQNVWLSLTDYVYNILRYIPLFQPFKYIIIQNVETSTLPVEHRFCKWEFLTARSFCISETTLLNLGREDMIISSRVEPINRITIYLQSWKPSDMQLLCNFCLRVRCCNLY